jgi:PAS domain S-box-containing protein
MALRILRNGSRLGNPFKAAAPPREQSADDFNLNDAVVTTENEPGRVLLPPDPAALRAIFDSISEGISVLDRDGNIVHMNPAVMRLLGLASSVHSRKRISEIFDILSPEGNPLPPEQYASTRALSGDFVRNYEMIVRNKETGNSVALECNTAPIHSQTGELGWVILSYRDVGQKKAHEAEIDRLTRLYATLSQVNQTIVRCQTNDELFDDVCRVAIEFGRFTAAWIGLTSGSMPEPRIVARRFVSQELAVAMVGAERGCRAMEDALKTGQSCVCLGVEGGACKACCAAGLPHLCLRACAAFPLTLGNQVCGVLGIGSVDPKFFNPPEIKLLEEVASDISFALSKIQKEEQRRKASDVLAEREEQLRLYAEHIPAATAMFDRDMRYLVASGRWIEDFGLAGQAILGRSHYEVFPDMPQRWIEVHRRCLEGAIEKSDEDRFERADGTVIWLRWEVRPWRQADGAIGGILIFSEDITDRKRAEQMRSQLSVIVEFSHDAIIGKDMNGVVTSWNRGAERLFGYSAEEMVGQSILRIIPADRQDEEARILATLARGEQLEHFETVRKAKDGRLIEVSITASPILDRAGNVVGISKVARDITEKRRLEAQLVRAQRMEAVGTLAGGIAHDLNNILTPIVMGVGMLLSAPLDADTEELVRMMQSSSLRGSSVVRQLLTFSRGVGGERTRVELRRLLKEMADIIRETFPRDISLSIDAPDHIHAVDADTTQLHQVLLNLCVNARDAMPDGGKLALAVKNEELSEADVAGYRPAKPGRYVAVTVTDTGQGIGPEIIDRIFDPFFTTKGPAKGTGLGLSTVLGIVRSHGGFVTVCSAPGAGATFAVHLPAADGVEPAASVVEGGPLPRGRGELILIVDDEASVLKATGSVLEKSGYRVLAARDGAEGLAIFSKNRGAVRVVLTDLMMPVMGGMHFVRALRTIKPSVAVIVTSGLIDPASYRELKGLKVEAILEKPCSVERLLETVRSELDRASAVPTVPNDVPDDVQPEGR